MAGRPEIRFTWMRCSSPVARAGYKTFAGVRSERDGLMEARRRMPERGRLHSAEAVAAVVRRALGDARPKARYFVGADVRGAFLLGRLVPSSARDAILRVLFGFPGAAGH